MYSRGNQLRSRRKEPAFCALLFVIFSALVFFAGRPAYAQTGTVLYGFSGPDGALPNAGLTADGKGNFFGTTYSGGTSVYGTVFELSPNGKGGWTETVLYKFTGGVDGGRPNASYLVLDKDGNLYGTASQGGQGCSPTGCGVVFELSPSGSNWTEKVLHSFSGGSDGAFPENGLIMDSAGNLFGVTQNPGTVFELSPSHGDWTERVIYTGGGTMAGLTMDTAGNIYGTAGLPYGNSPSTVFELSPDGQGGWTPTVIHTFAGYPNDGDFPIGTLVFDSAGNLYGTTEFGGAYCKRNVGPSGCGTVYKLSPGKNGQWTAAILESFFGGRGIQPTSGVTLDAAGNIYGTTTLGGKGLGGTVYKLVAGKHGKYKEKVLWTFDGTNGSVPYAGVILDREGNLYGTATSAGPGGAGVVFEVTP
jgi:uncharacterized repeat protein (TIGR03803 family)